MDGLKTMDETNNDQNQKPKISKLAIASIILLAIPFLLVVLLLILWAMLENLEFPNWLEVILLVVPLGCVFMAFILGITSLILIKKSNVPLSGSGRAVIAIVLSIIIIIFVSPIFTPYRAPSRLVCASNVKGLGTSILVYAHDYDDRLPTLKNWCDLLIVCADVDPRAFRCPESDARESESTYALNKNVVGMKLSEIPGDVVLMFETDFGRTEQARTGRVKYRQYFKPFIERQQSIEHKQRETRKGDNKVYILRWNQVGGPEDLTTEYHEGEGCNFLFADGHAEFVKKEALDTLRWEP